MFKPLEVYVGLRYTRAKRRNHFISFISFSSMLGIALGVAVVVSIDLSVDSARRAFVLSNEAVLGASTHRLAGGPSGIDEAIYVRLRERMPRKCTPFSAVLSSAPESARRSSSTSP